MNALVVVGVVSFLIGSLLRSIALLRQGIPLNLVTAFPLSIRSMFGGLFSFPFALFGLLFLLLGAALTPLHLPADVHFTSAHAIVGIGYLSMVFIMGTILWLQVLAGFFDC